MNPHRKSQNMRNTRLKNKRTADMAGLGAFPLVLDFLVSRLSTLVSFPFNLGVGRGFFIFLNLGSLSEPAWSLGSLSVFLRLLDFASGRGRAVRFFGRDGIWSSGFSARS